MTCKLIPLRFNELLGRRDMRNSLIRYGFLNEMKTTYPDT